jgi:hypothetical protein
MGLWEEQPVSLPSFKGLELGNESPLCGRYSNAKWEWFSEPLDCPPNEGCSPEPMVGTMNPLEGNPRPSRAGRKSGKFEPALKLSGTVASIDKTRTAESNTTEVY